MKLLLKKNILDLGSLGEIVDVKPGYARNYLIPQGLAIEVSNANLQWFEAQKRRLVQQEEEAKDHLRSLADRIEGTSVTVIARATEEGHLFGSVTPKVIADHLAQNDLHVETKSIQLGTPIKELGIYKVDVELHPEVRTSIKVWVVKGDEGQLPLEDDAAAAENDGETVGD